MLLRESVTRMLKPKMREWVILAGVDVENIRTKIN
jgi:hypothetical protein